MSWDPSDLNNDGRVDYVDQKIFDTQINPYSGEYEGPPVRESHFDSRVILYVIAGIAAMAVLAFMEENIGFFGQFLYGMLVLFFIPWKRIKKTEMPIASPYNKILPAAALILWIGMILILYGRLSRSEYYSIGWFLGAVFGNYISALIGVVLCYFACKKNKYRLFMWAIIFFGATSPKLLVEAILHAGEYTALAYFVGILAFASYLLTILTWIFPEKLKLRLCALICSVIWLLITWSLIAGFMILVVVCLMLSDKKAPVPDEKG